MCCRLTTCICGCRVKPATMILLWYDLLSFLFILIAGTIESSKKINTDNSAVPGFIFVLVLLLICVIGLYAVSKNNSVYFVPYLIMRFVWTFCVVFFVSILLLSEMLAVDEIEKFFANVIPQFIVNQYPDLKSSFENTSFLTVILEILIITLEVHFIMVIISCYNEIHEIEEHRDILRNQNYPMASPYLEHGAIRGILTPPPVTAPDYIVTGATPALATAPSFTAPSFNSANYPGKSLI